MSQVLPAGFLSLIRPMSEHVCLGTDWTVDLYDCRHIINSAGDLIVQALDQAVQAHSSGAFKVVRADPDRFAHRGARGIHCARVSVATGEEKLFYIGGGSNGFWFSDFAPQEETARLKQIRSHSDRRCEQERSGTTAASTLVERCVHTLRAIPADEEAQSDVAYHLRFFAGGDVDIADSVKYIAAAANALGLTLEEVLARAKT